MSREQVKTIQVDGVRVSYRELGAPNAPALLLLHAFPLHSGSFRAVAPLLAERYRVLLPDHRGFGQSGLGQEPATTMERLALDALAVLDDAKVESAVVGGVSMGGYAAMALLRHSPSRVRALLLVDTQQGPDDAAGKAKREENARGTLEGGMDFLVRTMLPKLLAPEASEKVREEVSALIRSNPPAGAAAALRGMALRADSEDILARFGNPAVIVYGEKDAITGKDKADAMAAVLSDAQIAQIPGVGHLSHLEAPEAFVRVVLELLPTTERS
jgi:pimeloyl-ACP methyl ester carboxylesterase